MPMPLTAPGVYIEEIPSGARPIGAVGTSTAAFVGYTPRGVDDRAKRIHSFADFERHFGGLDLESETSYAVQHFFQNGGLEAYVVRVPKTGATAAEITIGVSTAGSTARALQVTALAKGVLGNDLYVDIDHVGADDAFMISITNRRTGESESFGPVSMDQADASFVDTVINDEHTGSRLVRVKALGTERPAQNGTVGAALTLDPDGRFSALPKTEVVEGTKTYQIKIKSPAFPTETINVLAPGEPVPRTVTAMCRLLQQKIAAALGKTPGAAVRCTATTAGTGAATKPAIRVVVTVPAALDAVVEFQKGPGTAADADAVLRLTTGDENVSHYSLGSMAAKKALDKVAAAQAGTGLPSGDAVIGNPASFSGIYALDKVDLFNILCLPDLTRPDPDNPLASQLTKPEIRDAYAKAAVYCEAHRAFLLVDPPPDLRDPDAAAQWVALNVTPHKNAAAYYPRLKLADPLRDSRLRAFAPSGVVAGLFARMDATRGVWKAPAGVDAALVGVQELAYGMTDAENGVLNPLGLNCLRIFPVYGAVSWGARTLVGSDARADEWKYVPVRRLALFLEESLFRGTKWVVFEPNDEPLWAQIRLNVGAFMHTLFRQGAFQGRTPREAYFVRCDGDTTTQNDINRGVVNILVGFAPLKPAEFVVIQIQQMAGEIQV